MYKNNHYGLMLAIMVAADLQGIFEECRDASESIVEELLQRVVVFLTQPVDPHATFEFEKDLERLLARDGPPDCGSGLQPLGVGETRESAETIR